MLEFLPAEFLQKYYLNRKSCCTSQKVALIAEESCWVALSIAKTLYPCIHKAVHYIFLA
jgi:hypothetical protein